MQLRLLAVIAIANSVLSAQTARDYYNELYEAGGLDQILSEYACFSDEQTNTNFFLFAETKNIKEIMVKDGTFKKLPKATQGEFNKDTLFFRGYNKGVPFDTEPPYRHDGESWISEPFNLAPKTPARVRFTITWATMRYRRSVETLNPDGSAKQVTAVFGRCERIPTRVWQRGK